MGKLKENWMVVRTNAYGTTEYLNSINSLTGRSVWITYADCAMLMSMAQARAHAKRFKASLLSLPLE